MVGSYYITDRIIETFGARKGRIRLFGQFTPSGCSTDKPWKQAKTAFNTISRQRDLSLDDCVVGYIEDFGKTFVIVDAKGSEIDRIPTK